MSALDLYAVKVAQACQKPVELAGLRKLLEGERIKRVLEVGSWRGGMLWWYRHALKARAVVSVDLLPQPRADACFTGPSQSEAALAFAEHHGPYDLVFIDADHSYEAAKSDLERYGPLSRIVCLHDIVDHDEAHSSQPVEVERLWREAADGRYGKRGRVVLDPEWRRDRWGGIGVIFRDG